jgi:tRNA nucleotidyltransferase (CCA-adding enzyme)
MNFLFEIPPAVLEVHSQLVTAGFQAFLVGGCVRDLLRAQKPNDFDLCTSARPEQVQQIFKRVIPTGIEHGTVTVLTRGDQVEVTTFRSEAEYLDGRRPSAVRFETDITADLSRRDFTINAMAYDPVKNQLIDPFDGQGDLERRLIRCVGSALDRFLEDGLRPMRAVRFATTLEFELEAQTQRAITQTVHVFKKVATERIQQEFEKLLLASHPARGLKLLQDTGLLAAFFPEAQQSADFAALEKAPKSLPLRLALLVLALDPNVAKSALTRLKFPSKIAEEAQSLVRFRQLPSTDSTAAELRRWLARVGVERAPVLLRMHQALGVDMMSFKEKVDSVLAPAPPLDPKSVAMTGQDIMRVLKIPPSKLVGQAAQHLFSVVLEDPAQNNSQSLEAALVRWHFERLKID